jgi:hypothetical protein
MSLKSINQEISLRTQNIQKDGDKFDRVLLAGKDKNEDNAAFPRCEASILVLRKPNSTQVIDVKMLSSSSASMVDFKWKGSDLPRYKGQVFVGAYFPPNIKSYAVFRDTVNTSEKITADQFSGTCTQNGAKFNAKINSLYHITEGNLD